MNIVESSPLILREQPVRTGFLTLNQHQILSRVAYATQIIFCAVGSGFLLGPCNRYEATANFRKTGIALQAISYVVCGTLVFHSHIGKHYCTRIQREKMLTLGNLQQNKLVPIFGTGYLIAELGSYALLLASNIIICTVFFCEDEFDDSSIIPYFNLAMGSIIQMTRIAQAFNWGG